jgi:hypothetical protein
MKKLGLGALSLFAVSALALTLNKTPEAASPQFTTNAAFRDGLYQGKLAVRRRQAVPHSNRALVEVAGPGFVRGGLSSVLRPHLERHRCREPRNKIAGSESEICSLHKLCAGIRFF